jgi:energy-coupling factor transport system permease protein
MTSDKLIWLLGRFMPALALALSMTLRLVPRYTAQAKRIATAREGLGRGVSAGGVLARAREGLAIFSTMTTWSLEGAVDTADSMAARGFGSGRRTAYSDYRLVRRDALALGFVTLAALVCVVLTAGGFVSVGFFPRLVMEGTGGVAATALLSLVWAALCVFPLALGLREDAVWRALRKKVVT